MKMWSHCKTSTITTAISKSISFFHFSFKFSTYTTLLINHGDIFESDTMWGRGGMRGGVRRYLSLSRAKSLVTTHYSQPLYKSIRGLILELFQAFYFWLSDILPRCEIVSRPWVIVLIDCLMTPFITNNHSAQTQGIIGLKATLFPTWLRNFGSPQIHVSCVVTASAWSTYQATKFAWYCQGKLVLPLTLG